MDIDEGGKVTGITESVGWGCNIFLDCMLIRRKTIRDFIECYHNLDYLDITDILEENLDKLQVETWRFTGYEHAVDHAQDYLLVSQDLLRPEIQAELFPADRPILTKTQDSPPAKYLPGASVKNSMVAASCILAGTVLAFARALGEYGATSMVAGYTPGRTATISTTVYQLWRTNDDGLAFRWVLVNIAISFVVLLAVNLIEKRERRR